MRTQLLAAGAAAVACVANGASISEASQPRHLFSRQSLSNATTSNTTLPTSPPFYPSPWMDGSGDWGDAYEKAKAFVSQLTLVEKVNLTTGVGWESEACVGNTGSIPRLGFQSLCMQDSPLGIRFSDYNSAFPAGGTVAASWDRQVWYDRGYAMGAEHNGKGVDVQLGPVVGPLGRAPAGGRGWEGFSPDPFLSGQAVAQTVQGMQKAGIIACTKHYILNEQEHFRQAGESAGFGFNITESLSSNIDDKTLHELYLWPFADAVRAGTGSVMCSYNQINNSYGCQNSHLMNGILKGELGFQGFVMSDWAAQHAGVATTLAGLDMTMPGDTAFDSGVAYWGGNLTLSVINGTVPEWRLDDMVTRIMAAYYYVGRDAPGNVKPVNFNSWSRDEYGYQHAIAKAGYGKINERVDVRRHHAKIIRDHAVRSTVLLKNVDGALPLSGKEKMTAVFGDDAGDNTAGPNGCSDHGCDNGTLAMGWGSGTASFPYLISPLTAIQNEIAKVEGRVEWVTNGWDLTSAQALAAQAEVAITFVNADSGEGFISVDGNIGDRNNLTLWKNGDALIRNVSAVCNNTIVVVHSVGPVILDDYAKNPNITAIVWAGLPGEQTGNAIADILYGRVNPGGKLPFTIGASREDYGADVMYEPNNDADAPQDQFSEGIFIDYRAFDRKNIQPTYEFGFGLSYTTFEYSHIQVAAHTVPAYTPNEGMTAPAMQYGNSSINIEDWQYPADFAPINYYIYPWINGSDAKTASGDANYGTEGSFPAGSQDGSAQPKVRAGGAPGGNPRLYDVVYTIVALVKNTGSIPGDEVAQLYVNLGGLQDAPKILRGFDRITIAPGATVQFTVQLCRRDVMNWNTAIQDWEITADPKKVYVGGSSRNLPLSADLPSLSYA
ncbi:hypothetical protein BT63DRAFT_434521 [Microthyrium microscopicum]|uniref:beta-glucosidase n=1 Tax=Microthyrium microscopicum TaxID=703497 RepID=A0A6A6TZA7_9PEZI|nr:hypothetical protein BT63DRAFT_434521 [Microthyrium microscopicum]